MKPLVYQTTFGLADGAVSVMYGVALKECPDLKMRSCDMMRLVDGKMLLI